MVPQAARLLLRGLVGFTTFGRNTANKKWQPGDDAWGYLSGQVSGVVTTHHIPLINSKGMEDFTFCPDMQVIMEFYFQGRAAC